MADTLILHPIVDQPNQYEVEVLREHLSFALSENFRVHEKGFIIDETLYQIPANGEDNCTILIITPVSLLEQTKQYLIDLTLGDQSK